MSEPFGKADRSSRREMRRLANVLARPLTRKSFAYDPVAALRRAEIDADALPESLLDLLAGLSYDELTLIARFNEALVLGGFGDDDEDGGPVGFF